MPSLAALICQIIHIELEKVIASINLLIIVAYEHSRIRRLLVGSITA
ncbi:MAG: hypothetical protein KME50_00355 [Nostoc desertorum CM1-VF14]|jgi:nucleotide-binding universal stress UspA family protein|nr:hypothetical protein [Nostoc desertorum CM1-VF14]